MSLIVAGGRVLRPDMTVERADVRVEDGEIAAVGSDLEGDQRLDAEGCVVVPGLVNAHTHTPMTLLRGHADDMPLQRWLREGIWPVENELTPEDARAGARLAAVEMIRSGTTAFADMYFHVGEIAGVVEEAGLRALLSHGVVTVGKDDEAAREDVERSVEVAREFAGGADGRIRTAVSPHSLTTVGEEYLRDLAATAREADVPLHYHASENRDEVDPIVEERDVRPLAYAADCGMLTEDDLLAHCVHLDGGEVERLADSGAAAVHCPASNMKLASGMAPVQRMIEADVPVALGTDGAASNNDLDLFGEMRDAALLGKLAADDAAAVPAEVALRMATEGGARALGFETGRIEEGRPADLAVVDFQAPHLTPDTDPVSHLVYAATGADVRHTVCDGEVLMCDREVLALDAPAVRERAEECARDLLKRATADRREGGAGQ